MSKKILQCLAAFLVLSCQENDSNDQADQNEQSDETEPGESTGAAPQEVCDVQDIEAVGEAALSDGAYQALLTTGLFVGEAGVMTVSYNEGYNLNFEITEEEARSLLPCNLTPWRLKLLDSDDEPKYYLSWYLAVIDPSESDFTSTRIDLFTYAKDENHEPALHFVSSYMSVPEAISSNEALFGMFEEIFNYFAHDSRSGEPAYPHYYTQSLAADHDTFNLDYEDSKIELSRCDALSTDERFSLDFINANSQIYRTPIDKNVNYFNQSFINAKVETRDLDCVTHQNLAGFHPLLRDLRSIHFYGSSDKKITWFYETCRSGDCSNPFK